MIQFFNNLGPLSIVALVIAFDIFMWCGLIILIGRVSGWITLGQRY
jgi:hypothetical protein